MHFPNKTKNLIVKSGFYFGIPRSNPTGSKGSIEVGAGISVNNRINGLGGITFSLRHKLPIPTSWISSGKLLIPACNTAMVFGRGCPIAIAVPCFLAY